MTTTTFTVYTMTPKGGFSQKYEGTNEQDALKAYNKLEAKNAPRCLNKREDNGVTRRVKGDGMPE